jgi:flagellar FliJ protein
MPFRFSLQPVLRFRESFERRERLRLETVTREVVKARWQLEEAKQERLRALGEYKKSLRQGLLGAELQFELACDRMRVRQIAALKEQVSRLEELRVRQLEAFRKAQQQRKILENLRDRQFAAYRLIRDRRAQQQLDERFLILHSGQGSS